MARVAGGVSVVCRDVGTVPPLTTPAPVLATFACVVSGRHRSARVLPSSLGPACGGGTGPTPHPPLVAAAGGVGCPTAVAPPGHRVLVLPRRPVAVRMHAQRVRGGVMGSAYDRQACGAKGVGVGVTAMTARRRGRVVPPTTTALA